MRKLLSSVLLLGALSLAVSAGAALASTVEGTVRCSDTKSVLPDVEIRVFSKTTDVPFDVTTKTDEKGYYSVTLPDKPGDFNVCVVLNPDESVIDPVGGCCSFKTSGTGTEKFNCDFTVTSPRCKTPPPPPPSEGRCWLTGGGNGFETTPFTSGRSHNWGGNVNPGCSPTAGQGGNWNHMAKSAKLHFQGRAIRVIRCGNVDGIPPGSTSPATPFNFIEFTGTGRLTGMAGNKVDHGTVYFFGRVEDRSEPGSHGQPDFDAKDRYFLHVYANPADPAGSTLLLVDGDGDPTTVDPLVVSRGNMQLHISSCDRRAVTDDDGGSLAGTDAGSLSGQALDSEVWFAAPGPNPAKTQTSMKFSLPRDSDVSIGVFDVTGRMIRTLVDGPFPGGKHTMEWDLRDDEGSTVRGGVYFVRMNVNGRAYRQPITVVR